MILSEATYSNKNAIATNSIAPLSLAIGAKPIAREAYNASKDGAIIEFLKSSLCEYTAFATVLMLIIFQFSLYEFNSDEYLTSDARGAVASNH